MLTAQQQEWDDKLEAKWEQITRNGEPQYWKRQEYQLLHCQWQVMMDDMPREVILEIAEHCLSKTYYDKFIKWLDQL